MTRETNHMIMHSHISKLLLQPNINQSLAMCQTKKVSKILKHDTDIAVTAKAYRLQQCYQVHIVMMNTFNASSSGWDHRSSKSAFGQTRQVYLYSTFHTQRQFRVLYIKVDKRTVQSVENKKHIKQYKMHECNYYQRLKAKQKSLWPVFKSIQS